MMVHDDEIETLSADELRTDMPSAPPREDTAWLRSPTFRFPRPPKLPSFERYETAVKMTTFLASFGVVEE